MQITEIVKDKKVYIAIGAVALIGFIIYRRMKQ